jgi:hypothetical protein
MLDDERHARLRKLKELERQKKQELSEMQEEFLIAQQEVRVEREWLRKLKELERQRKQELSKVQEELLFAQQEELVERELWATQQTVAAQVTAQLARNRDALYTKDAKAQPKRTPGHPRTEISFSSIVPLNGGARPFPNSTYGGSHGGQKNPTLLASRSMHQNPPSRKPAIPSDQTGFEQSRDTGDLYGGYYPRAPGGLQGDPPSWSYRTPARRGVHMEGGVTVVECEHDIDEEQETESVREARWHSNIQD